MSAPETDMERIEKHLEYIAGLLEKISRSLAFIDGQLQSVSDEEHIRVRVVAPR